MSKDFRICRLCLSKTVVYFDLKEDMNLTMLQSITAIQIDSLITPEPSIMCLKCRLNLRLAYAIQQNIIKSHTKLNNFIKREESEGHPTYLEDIITIKTELTETEAEVETMTTTPSFQCHVCSESFSLQTNLMRHFRSNHREIIMKKCYKCNMEFIMGDYLRHMEIHDRQHKKFIMKTCRVCNKQFDQAAYIRHMRVHNSQTGQNIATKQKKLIKKKCHGCNKEFVLGDYYRHMKSHSGQNVHNITDKSSAVIIKECHMCNKEFVLGDYYTHMNTHKDQTVSTDVSCTVVHSHKSHNDHSTEEILAKTDNLISSASQKSRDSFQCHVCYLSFISKNDLMSHFRINHKNILIKKCYICDEEFVLGAYIKHMKTHNGQSNNTTSHKKVIMKKCHMCNQEFVLGDYLRHVKIHNGKFGRSTLTNQKKLIMKRCHVCNNEFVLGDYYVHMSTHKSQIHQTEIEAKTNTKCHVCSGSFISKKSLMCHFATDHKQIVIKKCYICDEEFILGAYIRHMKSHSGTTANHKNSILNKCREQRVCS